MIFTVGHSTHPIDEFIRILHAHGIRQLHEAGQPVLVGGLRHPRRDSINTGWRNAGFRGFADYMQTPEFYENLEKLIESASDAPTAMMCAEAVPWRCHRSLIADALVTRGITVLEILTVAKSQPHALTPFAKVEGSQVTYPGAADSENLELKFDGS